MDSALWVWLDLEMTGLNVEEDKILEVSCTLTSPDLNLITPEPFSMVIHQSDKILEEMSDWCIENHKKSGLTDAVRKSKHSLPEVEGQLIAFIQHKSMNVDVLYLAGNSIHMDRAFIQKHMPGLHALLHYRMIDVTGIRLFLETFGVEGYKKSSTHRACDDVLESIEELRYYKTQLLNHDLYL